MEKVGQQKEIFAMFSTEIKQFKTSRKINGLKHLQLKHIIQLLMIPP